MRSFKTLVQEHYESVKELVGRPPPRKVEEAYAALQSTLDDLDAACPCSEAQWKVINELLRIKFEPYASAIKWWIHKCRPRKSSADAVLLLYFNPEWLAHDDKGNDILAYKDIAREIELAGGEPPASGTTQKWRATKRKASFERQRLTADLMRKSR